jgi:hypothetical protein
MDLTGPCGEPSPRAEAGRHAAAEADAWRLAGFDPDQASCWIGYGCDDPAEARAWDDTGFDPWDYRTWTRAWVSLADAVRWRNIGMSAAEAEPCIRDGLSPADARAALLRPR